ncbi:hypothetical protein MMC22_006724 [Lobaria immixta]|nr:hypothetical protein [Lobaria immixta]
MSSEADKAGNRGAVSGDLQEKPIVDAQGVLQSCRVGVGAATKNFVIGASGS